MIRLVQTSLFFALILFSNTIKAAIAELPISLNEQVVVNSDKVTLGDLFQGIPAEKENIVATYAPAIGKEVTLSADWLEKLAKNNGLSWVPAGSNVKCIITTSAHEINESEIADQLKTALVEKGLPEQAEVILMNNNLPVLVRTDDVYTIRFSNAVVNPKGKNFRVKMIVETENATKTASLTGKFNTFINVLSAKNDLSVGSVLSEQDLKMKKINQTQFRKSFITDFDKLVGKEIKRPVQAGQILDETDVKTHVVMAKGKLITLIYKKGNVSLSAQGKTLEAGGINETIRVTNTQSKSTVQATIISDDTAVVVATHK
ncbi:MAG: flagellar basal body P-ring formation chaperone FlgA [Alphaproteobacteria bacterium]|nr:flagellar basal body P-ring formation chaperone FlgA [Alphaproteobacteria bacterium]